MFLETNTEFLETNTGFLRTVWGQLGDNFGDNQVPSSANTSKTTSISAKSAFDFLHRAFNLLSKSATSGNSATAGAEFLLSGRDRCASLSSCSSICTFSTKSPLRSRNCVKPGVAVVAQLFLIRASETPSNLHRSATCETRLRFPFPGDRHS
jgi:hypothetical protein